MRLKLGLKYNVLMLGHITSKSIKATRGVNFDKYTLIKHFYSNNYTFTS